MDTEKLKYWIALGMVSGVGSITYKLLLDRFGGPETVFESIGKCKVEGVSKDVCQAIVDFNDWNKAEEEVSKIDDSCASVITINDEEYPEILKSIYDPPPYFHVKGDITLLNANAIAIIGSRNPTHYGKRMSEEISRDLASHGLVIVSGMARGCDSFAHFGALSVEGSTIGVLGTGIDIPYPRENKRLYERIMERGLLISEFPMGAKPYPTNFPQRNRIISGLSLGVLVIEASPRSGSLITARYALECGRDVFALPGNVTSMKSRGTNNLLKDGATLVEGARDILNSFSLSNIHFLDKTDDEPRHAAYLREDEALIVKVLGEELLNVDDIIHMTGLPTHKVVGTLLDMELKGLLKQHPGKRYVNAQQFKGG